MGQIGANQLQLQPFFMRHGAALVKTIAKGRDKCVIATSTWPLGVRGRRNEQGARSKAVATMRCADLIPLDFSKVDNDLLTLSRHFLEPIDQLLRNAQRLQRSLHYAVLDLLPQEAKTGA